MRARKSAAPRTLLITTRVRIWRAALPVEGAGWAEDSEEVTGRVSVGLLVGGAAGGDPVALGEMMGVWESPGEETVVATWNAVDVAKATEPLKTAIIISSGPSAMYQLFAHFMGSACTR